MVFQPLSLPPGTTSTLSPIFASDLACSLEYTRFVPFGYKLITFDPPQTTLDPPARIYWEVPDRYKSLDQIKFLTVPSPGASLLCTAPLNQFLCFCEFVIGLGLQLRPFDGTRRQNRGRGHADGRDDADLLFLSAQTRVTGS